MKRKSHVCQNCWYFMMGKCYNCDSPSDIRDKNPDDVCDGGGVGADGLGFESKAEDDPIEKDDDPIEKDDDLEGKILKLKAENEGLKVMLKVMDTVGCALLDFIESKGLTGECKRYLKAKGGECDHKS